MEPTEKLAFALQQFSGLSSQDFEISESYIDLVAPHLSETVAFHTCSDPSQLP
ncbi:hypothetical protein [Pedobacter psychroterrae]|uniref:hypothetical protein n=1 Tax=Pedobacter psychroterrae TaxID=2530453 RepID=UPI0013F1433E|nr:hypothetical protein [Pedobacter psychroterrae]